MHNHKPVYDMTKKNFQLKISFAVILKSFRVTKKDNKLPVNKKKMFTYHLLLLFRCLEQSKINCS